MVSICRKCKEFKKSYRSTCKCCSKSRRLQGRGFKSIFQKVKCTAKKALQSDVAKLAISKGLGYLPRLYAKGASKYQRQKD